MVKRIRDLMTRSPIVLSEDDTAGDAARMMRDREVGDVLVRANNGTLLGIVTDRDLVVRCLAEDEGGRAPLSELCTTSVNTLDADASIDDAVSLMRTQAVRRIPVVEEGNLVGIVSLGDLARERDPASALGAISAAPANA